ncbi:MAG TPA: ketopantoate reductase family protein, partial [Spirochaetes bacterium]|nr:ketopantoate reductase family protein [Spirochaetota bacterium]
MKILLIGTGGLGCFYGGKIARLGGDITFLSRGESFEIIKEKGITVKSEVEESFHTPVKIIDRLPANPHYDLVIIATKSYDVQALVSQLPESLLSSSYFMTLQNGLMSEDILCEKTEPSRLIPATAFVALRKSEVHVVNHTAGGRFQFGAYWGGQQKGFLSELAGLLKGCQIDTHFSENIVKMKWGKLVWNAAYNPLSTITRLKLGNIITNPYGVKLLRDSMKETASLAE